MNDCGLIAAVSGIACTIIKSCSDDEISILSAVLTQLGDTLGTYLTQKEICKKRLSDNNDDNADNQKEGNNNKHSELNKNSNNINIHSITSPENDNSNANTDTNPDTLN
ncbi:MAG TPA: DUF6774 domain-containing protein [Mobilitalea sp.]|nr:DUF6774 domain-containing protein [Mobilitalea sp.]